MGAGTPLNRIFPVPVDAGIGKLVGSPPTMLTLLKRPSTPGKIPLPVMVTIDPGAAATSVAKLAPLANFMFVGPLAFVLRLNVTVKVPNDAAMVTGPEVP